VDVSILLNRTTGRNINTFLKKFDHLKINNDARNLAICTRDSVIAEVHDCSSESNVRMRLWDTLIAPTLSPFQIEIGAAGHHKIIVNVTSGNILCAMDKEAMIPFR